MVERETIELAFLAAMQVLPPRQRAALIARDVLGWPASETATLLETSVAAANSALQRARATMSEHLPAKRSEWSAGSPSDEERDLLARFIDAHERYDGPAAIAISAQDLRITMPPYPYLFEGIDVIGPLIDGALREGEWRLLATWANRMPTAASYLRSKIAAPIRSASWHRSGDGSRPTTLTPAARRICVSSCPTRPSPMTQAVSPSRASDCR